MCSGTTVAFVNYRFDFNFQNELKRDGSNQDEKFRLKESLEWEIEKEREREMFMSNWRLSGMNIFFSSVFN